MRKLNRKGFTLVELLAVIVILAIVVGITLVTVLPTLKKSRQEAFELTAQTAADYLEKQYQLYVVGEVDTIPGGLQTSFAGLTFTDGISSTVPFTKTSITDAGLKPSNYVSGTWYIIQSSGRVCVKLDAATNTTKANNKTNLAGEVEAGEYYDATENDSIEHEGKTVPVAVAQSSACE